MTHFFPTLSGLVCAAAAACALMLAPVQTAAQTIECSSPSDADRLDYPLRRVGQRVAARQPLTVVAIGSSSTAGAGASSSAASYPSRLEIELKERFRNLAVRVLNRGVGGEEIADMLARFDKAVVAEQPDLVVWQLGTNSVLRDRGFGDAEALIHQGIARIKSTGADVVLIDPQFAPKVIAKADAERMVDLIGAAAKMDNVSVFHRFVLMRYWNRVRKIPFDTFVSPDGLHMNDWSYACVAKVLAGAIHDAATRATAVAGAPHAR
jgi:acyl-CoA thioesterase-1